MSIRGWMKKSSDPKELRTQTASTTANTAADTAEQTVNRCRATRRIDGHGTAETGAGTVVVATDSTGPLKVLTRVKS